jgi:diguanylate cyclase (GGDEF)-like protein
MGLLVLETGTVDDHRVAQEDEGYRRMTLEQVALSIGNLQLRESLRQQSIRDVLTGLYNRRFLEESVRRELSRATRLQEQGGDGGVALLMIDVDHFKRFNDQHGHEVGDRVLREVGQILQRVTRVSDVAARYGGEEFTILMTDTTAELGRQRAEQIRTAVERMAIEALGTAVGEVTISIGLAQFPAHGSTMEALLLAADKALYQAKHTGRNRVVVAVAA